MTKRKKIFLSVIGLLIVFIIVFVTKGVNTFSIIAGSSDSLMALNNDERWDILILGQQPTGGLTDSIMVLSYKKETEEMALFSIPRDLFVEIPEYGEKRINFAYVAGETNEKNGGGLKMAKKVVGDVVGLDIDFAIIADVEALKEIVDGLDGIDVYEDKYFSMDFYGNYVKIYPGTNHLSGSETLAYVGSRSIDSDFGRMDRQQKVLMAIKEKTFSLNFLARPDKIWNILDSLEDNIRTDLPANQLKELIKMADNFEIQNVEKTVFDTSNYLYSTHSYSGAYVLLPNEEGYLEIHEKCQNVFGDSLTENNNEEETMIKE